MTEHTKHTMDILSFLAGITAWLKVFTDLLGFFIAVAGAAWWIWRWYSFFKGRKHGD